MQSAYRSTLQSAQAFLRSQFAAGGGLLMDARSPTVPRSVPAGWRDIYLTCLLVQENRPEFGFDAALIGAARTYIVSMREAWCWRYLPDLCSDLDETAMAWAALEPGNRGLDAAAVARLEQLVNADGGFPTFLFDVPIAQRSHPTVTLNVLYALATAKLPWPNPATAAYIGAWIERPDFPACAWMGSAVFPMFLLARTLRETLSGAQRARVIERITAAGRRDGTWGDAGPEPFDTALAVMTLGLLGCAPPRPAAARTVLTASQRPDGSWPWSPVFTDDGDTAFGHAAVTTAFALAALTLLTT